MQTAEWSTFVPEELRKRTQWVCWRFVSLDGRHTKVPFDARSGGPANSTDPRTWVSFDDAVAAWRTGAYEGVGFVFTAGDPYTGVDLDGCIDDAGEVVPAAKEIIESLNSYTEISPSGRGVKVFVIGRKPQGARCRSKAIQGFKEVEIYDRGRFFTVTGRHLSGTPLAVEDRQPQLDALCALLWPKTPPARSGNGAAPAGFTGDDDSLIRRACAAKNGDRFKRLWEGDTSLHGGDHSGADQALCNYLAFWTGKDPARMDRLFRHSGLFREKWDEHRGGRTYGVITIDKAITDCVDVFSPSRQGPVMDAPLPADEAPDSSEIQGGLVPLGQRDPTTGRLVLSPRRTLPTAQAYIREFNLHADVRTLHCFGGQLMHWRDNRYIQVEEDWLKQRLQPWLHNAQRYVLNKRTGALELVEFESNPTTVKQALESICSYVHLSAATVSPSWLDDGAGRPPAHELLPCRTMSLHIPTGHILAPTPSLFTMNALDFDYDPNAATPERWFKFLEQLFGNDLESMDLLQEWCGYCLTSDTSLQKMLLVVGPRRSGKGTIGRILTRLVGAGNVVGPTTGSLAGPFGLQPLIGKSLAIVSDARFRGDNVGTAVERLLCISGEDTMTIDRKHLGAVSMKLPTRFMFLTNELPRLTDASTALAGRFLVLRLNTSFYGQEDVALTEHLLDELPGILVWAIEGWRRLKARGRFLQPQASEDAIRDIEDLSSPVGAFVRDRCMVGVGHRVDLNDLYQAWCDWCEQEGRDAVSTKQTFGRDLVAAVCGVERRRRTGGVGFYEGISLRVDLPG